MKEEKILFYPEAKQDSCRIDISKYTHIRAFHACRPMNLDAYVENGIVPLSKDSAMSEALVKLRGSGLSDSEIIKTVERKWDNEELQCVWLDLSREALVTMSGHYLLYGSEFINAVAGELWKQYYLRKNGIPTLIECKIPVEDIIPFSWGDDFNTTLNRDSNDISIRVPMVKKEDIVRMEQPKEKIPNPYRHMALEKA